MNLKEKYADLIVRSGLNVQKDQIVVIRASVEMNEFVRLVAKACFEVGQKTLLYVIVMMQSIVYAIKQVIVCLMTMKHSSLMKLP